VVLVSVINVVAAARVDSPWSAESRVMAAITPAVLDEVEPDAGQVVLADGPRDAVWYSRGLVLALEKAGLDARVPRSRVPLFGESREVDPGEPAQATFLVVQGDEVRRARRDPSLRLVTRWRPEAGSEQAAALRRLARLDRRLARGEITSAEHVRLVQETIPSPPAVPLADDLAVFAVEPARDAMP
jgi:hypothetical protein